MINTILVAVDGSEPSNHALKYALGLAKAQKSKVVVVSVVPDFPVMYTDEFQPEYLPKFQDDMEEYYGQTLRGSVKKASEEYPGIEITSVLKQGKPEKQIIEAAKEKKVDLIVLGNRGTGGILSWVLGSVSRKVVDSCTVPVLVVKDQEYCET